MSDSSTDDLATVVRCALAATRATTICPFHPTVTIRVGDDAAETRAYLRVRKLVKGDGTTWGHDQLENELKRQLETSADGVCPACAAR